MISDSSIDDRLLDGVDERDDDDDERLIETVDEEGMGGKEDQGRGATGSPSELAELEESLLRRVRAT
jgi:hypothetical protein